MLTINKGIQQNAVKVVVYGVEGIGKTTFASHFPAPLFLDLDRGSRRMDVDRIDSIQDWPALMGTLDQIQRDPSLPYSTIVIDTADMAAKLASAYICKANGSKKSIEEFGYGKGYVILAEEFSKLLVNAEVLVNMGFNVVFLAHAMQRTVTRPDDTGSYDHWEMKLPGARTIHWGLFSKSGRIFCSSRTTKSSSGRAQTAKERRPAVSEECERRTRHSRMRRTASALRIFWTSTSRKSSPSSLPVLSRRRRPPWKRRIRRRRRYRRESHLKRPRSPQKRSQPRTRMCMTSSHV